jgi:hypothetical protein
MNNQQKHSSLQANCLAEGTLEITNTLELTNGWKRSLIVHSDLVIKEHSAKARPQNSVEHEGRDDIDSQDAVMTSEEARTGPHKQTVPYVASNGKPVSVVMAEAISMRCWSRINIV